MVTFCGVFACGKRGSHLPFFRLPKIRLTEGEQTRQLSEERQRAWALAARLSVSNIGRSDIKVKFRITIHACLFVALCEW